LRLDLAPPGQPRSDHDLDTDAGLLAADYASLTSLVGVREAAGAAEDVVGSSLRVLAAVIEGEAPRTAEARRSAGGSAGA